MDRLICKHFNLPWTTIRDDLSWSDYYCLLAVALDAEELAKYEFIGMTHGSDALKKWKWTSIDEAGTKPLPEAMPNQPADQLSSFVSTLLAAQTGDSTLRQTGSAEMYAQATGRRIGYVVDADKGIVVDEEGNQVSAKEAREMVLVPMSYKTNK